MKYKLPKFKIKIYKIDIIIWLLLFLIGFEIMSEIKAVQYRISIIQSHIVISETNVFTLKVLKKLLNKEGLLDE